MVAREQDLGHRPAAPLRGPRVVRVLRRALQRRAEGLLERRLGVPERARELAQHGVEHDHRRQLAAGEHVAADRDLVGAEVVDDPLVEALVAAAQQRQRRLGRQLARRARRRAAARPASARSRAAARAARPGPRRSGRAARPPSRRRAAPSRRRRRTACRRPRRRSASSSRAGRRTRARGRARARWSRAAGSRYQSNQLREQREDVNVHRRTPGRRRSGGPRCRSSGSRRARAGSAGRPTSSASHDGSAIIRSTTPTSVSPSTTRQPSRSRAQNSPSSSGGASSTGHAQLGAAQRLGLVARAAALDAQDRLLGRARAARQRDAAVAQQQLLAAGEQLGVGAHHVEGAVEPVRPADVAGQQRLTRRCRRGRGGCP